MFFGCLALLFALFMLIMGSVWWKEPVPDAAKMAADVGEGDPAYAQIVLIEEYGYGDGTTYYLYLDEDWNAGIVVLSPERAAGDFAELLRTVESRPGAAVRSEGVARKMPADLREFLEQEDFASMRVNLDTYLADGESWEHPSAKMFGLGAGALVLALFLLWYGVRPRAVFRRCVRALDRRGLAEAALEQFAQADVIQSEKVAISEHFVYGLGSGAILPARDILWCRTLAYPFLFGNPLARFLMARDARRDYVLSEITKPGKDADFAQTLSEIMARNPDLLVGTGWANNKAYRRMRKEAKNTEAGIWNRREQEL